MTLDPRTLVALIALVGLIAFHSAVGIVVVTVAYFLWPVMERLMARTPKPKAAPAVRRTKSSPKSSPATA